MEINQKGKTEEKPEIIKAVGLYSGGLDSILAIKLIQSQGIDVYAYNLKTIFWGKHGKDTASNLSPSETIKKLGANYEEEEVTPEYLEVVMNPANGYGSNMNPCIDCKIFFMKKAKEYMERIGAKFMFTGEVLGQRPMTQNLNSMKRIMRLAEVEDICVKPLSAKLLDPTLPEREGWLDRELLLGIHGRGRSVQIALARQMGITEYPAPAGGCLLTDPNFSGRLYDLLKSENEFNTNNIMLLKTGRHFRLSPKVKCIVSRDESDGNMMVNLAEEGDIVFELADDLPGPVVLLRGEGAERYITDAAKLCRKYSHSRNNPDILIRYWQSGKDMEIESTKVENVSEDFLKDKLVRGMHE